MDFYVILGLNRGASQGEVKRAYKRVARRYHPDINPGDREAAAFYRCATEAYETLIDPDRRQEYDAHGVAAPLGEPAAVEFLGFDFSVSGTGGGASATFQELFSEVNRALGSGNGAARGRAWERRPRGDRPGVSRGARGSGAAARHHAARGLRGVWRDRPPPGAGRSLRNLSWHRDDPLAARAHDSSPSRAPTAAGRAGCGITRAVLAEPRGSWRAKPRSRFRFRPA